MNGTELNCSGDVSPVVRNAVAQLIREGVIGSAVYKCTSASTNTDALSDLQLGRPGESMMPRLYLTDRQTAGRGRQGNVWVSDDQALTFSLVVRWDQASAATTLLSPAIGVAVARAIEFVCAPCQIALKWPNDICALWHDDGRGNSDGRADCELRKLGGILIESAASVQQHSVIGVGLNLNQKPDLNPTVSTPAASLADLLSRTIRRDELLAAVVQSIVEILEEFPSDPKALLDQYRLRCALQGKDLSFRQKGSIITGYCAGIVDDGSLEMVIDGRAMRFRSGEVHRVRAL